MEIIVAIATIVGAIAGVIAIIPVLRQGREKRPTTEEILTERLRVLAVISAPVLGAVGDVPPAMRLDIWREWQNLADAIKAPHPDGRGKPIALTRLLPPTSDRLRRALAGCDVLHFCGHGTASGLLLETEHGREDMVSSEDFAALFAGSKVKLVVLSACESNHTADALRKAGVPAGIATRERVSDDVANRFASHFYAELTDGKPFAAALKTAQAAIARQYGTEASQNFTLLGKVKSRLKMPAKPAEPPLVELGEPECIGLPTHLGMVNRGAELVGISERFEQASTRLVGIYGIGGIGKSYIAAEAARRNAWRFPDGILWLRVGEAFQLADLCRHIGYLLGFQPEKQSEEELQRQALMAIRTRKCLIILDQAETIPPDKRERIARFLGEFDPRHGSKVLLTARERIAEFNQLDGAAPLDTIPPFEDTHARQLLSEEGWQHNLSNEIERHIAEFLRHGRGHPFLLSRSVAWAKDRGVEPVLRELATLTGDAEAAAKELVGKMAVALNAPGRDVLQRMPLFVGGADEAAVHAVCGETAADGIRELTQRGLLDFDHQTQRYTLHQLVVDYVSGYMPLEAEAARAARLKHAQHYATVAERYDETPMEKWRDLDADWENVRNGANFATCELAGAFGVGDDAESLQNLLAEVRTIEGNAEPVLLAADYAWALFKYVYWRRPADRLRWLLAGAVTFQAQGDEKRLGMMYNSIGSIYNAQGEYASALEWCQKSVAIKESIGDRAGLAGTYNIIGLIYNAQGESASALEWYQKSVAITKAIGDRATLAATYNNIGLIYDAQGESASALEWYQKSTEITESIGDRATLAITLHNMCMLEIERGQLRQALDYFRRSRDLYAQLGLEKDVADEEKWIAEVQRRMV